jgi:hypothetical protein
MARKRFQDSTLLVKYVRRNDALLELQIRISVFGLYSMKICGGIVYFSDISS